MAYGKDDEQRKLVQQGAFRSRTFNQASRALSRQRFPNQGGGSGGGSSLYWIDQYQPPVGYDSQIRLLLGSFKQEELVENGSTVDVVTVDSPIVKFVEHFDGAMQKGCICSAGALANYKDRRKDCYGCDIYWATAARNTAGRFESSRMSKQGKFAFALFDYRPYHHVEVVDRETGQPKKNNQGQVYKDWKVCTGRGCDYCKQNIEMKMGHSTHWAVNFTQLQAIRAAERDIGRSCAVCGNVDCIHSIGWMCESCGEGVIDMSTTELQPKELIERTENEQVCPYCQHNGFLNELYQCKPCSERGQSGLRATLFDVDLTITMLVLQDNKKQLLIKKFSPPQAIAPEFVEAAKPVDLIKKYRPDSLQAQASKFGYAPPPPAGGQPAAQQPYQNPNGPKLAE